MDGTGVKSHMGGPIPKFNDYHIWKALYCLNSASPVGRKKLAELIGLGEGSTRTLLSILQDAGAISIKKKGVTLTPEGKKLWASVAMNIAAVDLDTLTIGKFDCAVKVPHGANRISYGCEERDSAIKNGAVGATTLVFSNGQLTFPGDGYPLEDRYDKIFKRAFALSDGDAVIIGTADDYPSAEEGAVSAGLEVLGGLNLQRSSSSGSSALSSSNELLALAFMVHDLVGGLPVCAKSKDNLGIRIENGKVIDNAYTGAVLEEVLKVGTTIRRIATSGPYKGIRVIVTPLEVNNRVIAAIGVVDLRSMTGLDDTLKLMDEDPELN